MTSHSNSDRCPHREVSGDGRILCGRLAGADREVTLDLCGACPARAIACSCLRFTLQKRPGGAILVRQLGGHSYWLEGEPGAPSFQRAACAARAVPIASPDDCRGCALRPHAPQAISAPPSGTRRAASKVIPFPVPLRQVAASAGGRPGWTDAPPACPAGTVNTCPADGLASHQAR